MKKIFRDLKNTFVTHWAVGSDRATAREYLTSNLIVIILLPISVELIVLVFPASAVVLVDPNCKVVTEPPNEMAEPSIDIEEFVS